MILRTCIATWLQCWLHDIAFLHVDMCCFSACRYVVNKEVPNSGA